MSQGALILALDCSVERVAVALVGRGHEAVLVEDMVRGHAERLMPMAEAVLAGQGLVTAELDAVAVCIGPGSFTGIRVATAAARGLALGLGCPAVGVTRLEAIARAAGRGPLTVLLAGKGGQGFRQDFGPDGAPLAPPWTGAEAALRAGALPRLAGDLAGGAGAADPRVIAAMAADRLDGPVSPPAPLYLRTPDAALPAEPPPRHLGPAA